MKDNALMQFAVLVLAVTAGQLLLKMGVAYLPDSGIPGAVKAVVGKL